MGKFLRIITDNARPDLSSCLAWGCGNTPDEGEGGKSGANKKSRGKKKKEKKKKKKKCGEKRMKRG